MKKKTIVVTGIIISIFLIGIISASLLTYFGKITGSVEVKAPVFYLDGSQPIDGYLGLAINNEEVSYDPVDFTGSESKFFISESLGVESFYEADWDLTLSLRTEDNVTGKVDVYLYTIQGDDPHFTKESICTNNPYINIPQLEDSDFHTYSVICEGKELTDMDEEDRLVLELKDGFNDIIYYIQLNGNSKIEVSAT